MNQIYPLHEENIQRFCGLPVCVVMLDGTRHIGVLSHCGSGRVTLNGEEGISYTSEAEAVKAQPKKEKGKKSTKNKEAKQPEAQTQSYPYDPNYYGPGPFFPFGGVLGLDLALIAFLFLLI